jgi:hypothetical protein
VLKINPKRKTDLTDIENILSNWNDPSLINRRKSILVTVMKQGKHLKNLIDLFKSIDTKGVPTLIIDDE